LKQDDFLYLKRSEVEKKHRYYFTLPSNNKAYSFMDMRSSDIDICPDIPKAGEEEAVVDGMSVEQFTVEALSTL
jgi:hypothetical protein